MAIGLPQVAVGPQPLGRCPERPPASQLERRAANRRQLLSLTLRSEQLDRAARLLGDMEGGTFAFEDVIEKSDKWPNKPCMCSVEHCGKIIYSRANFYRHRKQHEEPQKPDGRLAWVKHARAQADASAPPPATAVTTAPPPATAVATAPPPATAVATA